MALILAKTSFVLCSYWTCLSCLYGTLPDFQLYCKPVLLKRLGLIMFLHY
jgi:hypothetical protein